jgi:putative endonuclease
MNPRYYYVYMLASGPYGTLYVGVTSDLTKRAWEHRNHVVEGFSKAHATDRLVWYEQHQDVIEAITREKRIKKWNRDWKVNLIQAMNPEWRDLFEEVVRG